VEALQAQREQDAQIIHGLSEEIRNLKGPEESILQTIFPNPMDQNPPQHK